MTRILLTNPRSARIGGTRMGSRMPRRTGLGALGEYDLKFIVNRYSPDPLHKPFSNPVRALQILRRDAGTCTFNAPLSSSGYRIDPSDPKKVSVYGGCQGSFGVLFNPAVVEEAPGTDTETPAPSPSPTVYTKSDYESATQAIKELAASMNACSVPATSPLPGSLPPYTGEDSGTAEAYDIYTSERDKWSRVQETAAVACASEGSGPQIPSSDPYNSKGALQNEMVEEYEPIDLPEDEPLGTGVKIGIGVGGVLILGGLAWLLFRRKGGRR